MRFILFILVTLVLAPFNSMGQTDNTELTWPREMELGKYLITLYQPQLENFEGNKLDGRMAVSIKTDDNLFFWSGLD